MPEESTTPDLEERLRKCVEGFSHRDMDASIAAFAIDAVWESAVGMGTYEGRDAIRGFLQDWIGAYEDYEVRLEEFCDLGNGVSFAVLLQRGRLPDSSGLIDARTAFAITWTDGLISRSTVYGENPGEARAAAERLAEERG